MGCRDAPTVMTFSENPQGVAGVREGETLAGKYCIERVLGAGGMGVVVAARHLQLDEHVAIKFLLPSMLANADAVARFVREARAAVKIRSEHVARVLDVGTLDTGAPFIVMEYLEGGDLAEWLARRGPLPIEQAVDFVLQACVALADAHSLGIVHRDLKPANLFCARRTDGEIVIKVLDFGISKMTGPAGTGPADPTKTSTVIGTPFYMSPEQMQSAKGVDARADLWALGVILFQLVTGAVPFTGESVPEIAIKVATMPPPSASALRRDLPPLLERVIGRCLEKDPSQRYSNVAELAVALAPLAAPRAKALVERVVATVAAGGGSTQPNLTPADRSGVAPATAPAWTRSRGDPGSPRRRAPWLAGVLGAGALASGLGYWAVPSVWPPRSTHASGAEVAAAPPPARTDDPSAPVLAPPAMPPPAERLLAEPATPEPASTKPAAAAPAPATAHVAAAAHPVHAASVSPGASPTVGPSSGRASRAPKPDCDPPYTLDDKAQKHFKPECYQ
jgi:eukaryotic-like serine/threonine-protein kinase